MGGDLGTGERFPKRLRWRDGPCLVAYVPPILGKNVKSFSIINSIYIISIHLVGLFILHHHQGLRSSVIVYIHFRRQRNHQKSIFCGKMETFSEKGCSEMLPE